MIASRHINKIVAALVALAVAAILVLQAFAQELDPGVSMAYEDIFDTSEILTIDIQMSADQWQDLLDNATAEEYYACDIVINGETCTNVGIRAKGNTSLSSVASSDSDRYSFKIQFDEYVTGQTFQGLDKMVLNNSYADATMMKEAITYDMFAFLGADASLYNYAEISVNGEYIGVYLALEAVEESFALRNYGVGYGELYKPDSMDMGGGNSNAGGGMQRPDMGDMPEMPADGQMPQMGEAVATAETGGDGQSDEASQQQAEASDSPVTADGEAFTPPTGGGNGGGGFGGFGSSSATALNYIDDDLDSYSEIWDSSVFDSGDADHQRVVTALANIDAGTDLDTYLDVDNMLRYLAVQTFVVNLDSLTGTMAHNYYLYEDDGQLNLIPWDYNLAFGGFQSSDASSTINMPIDTPYVGTDAESRRIFSALLENEEYLAQYHEYLSQLVEEYVFGGRFDEVYNRIRGQIDGLVETDPTAFYTYEEYEAATEMFYQTVQLRAESIRGQLAGDIPSTTEGQEAQPELLLDSSSIDLSVMGVMMNGGGGGGGERGGRGRGQDMETSTGDADEAATEESDTATGWGMPMFAARAEEAPDGETAEVDGEAAGEATAASTEAFTFPGGGMEMPQGFGDMSFGETTTQSTNNTLGLLMLGGCLLGILIALGWAWKYKRR